MQKTETTSAPPDIKPWVPKDEGHCGHGMLIRTSMAEWTCYQCRVVFRHTWLARQGHSHVVIERRNANE